MNKVKIKKFFIILLEKKLQDKETNYLRLKYNLDKEN